MRRVVTLLAMPCFIQCDEEGTTHSHVFVLQPPIPFPPDSLSVDFCVVVVTVIVDLRLVRSCVFSESHVNTHCSNVDLQTYANIHQYIKLAPPVFVLSSTVDYIFCYLI